MTTNRLEAFSDGVLAIIITIMVLEMKVPEGADFTALKPIIPKFISYILSFIYIGIYWNNHHHLFHVIQKVNGKLLWANLFLLFCLSLIPFSTGWMGENHFDKNPVALYGVNLFLCALAFILLEKSSIHYEGENSKLKIALKNYNKESLSLLLYFAGVILSYFIPIVSMLLYAGVALLWLIPDTRIEKTLNT
ncbi:TMEM175 family protein [Flavobacterium sp. NRK F10]|uniref:TMEM175 family protein n=1 Tax=Flavobacterium sp. NRK F10 TaxID=2954931 RepID=UPI0020913DBE|nr:TMEM175 family protein [Flavobacterium sp. NRK F10]MCO6173517.1 TMEM175 family protein [Flavobacterium sp. NRK F10]